MLKKIVTDGLWFETRSEISSEVDRWI